ncbi:MAG: signal peptidase I [Candidatus Peribacteraceae bacterium]
MRKDLWLNYPESSTLLWMARQQQQSIWFHFLDVLLNIVIIVAIVGLIRTFLVSPFQVEGDSMVDTLEDGEYIIINKLTYYIGQPQRGDVVVFRPPNDHSKHYVKRIIGVPGDEISIRNGFVYIKEKGTDREVQLEELYLNDTNAGHTYKHPPSTQNQTEENYGIIPEGFYFLMGDNRMASRDSRSFPDFFVPEDDIKGRVWFVALPFNKLHVLEEATYTF